MAKSGDVKLRVGQYEFPNNRLRRLTVNNSVSCIKDLLSPASRQRMESTNAAMAHASENREDNLILRNTVTVVMYEEERMTGQNNTTFQGAWYCVRESESRCLLFARVSYRV